MSNSGRKCGVILPTGRCKNPVVKDTSRCWLHKDWAPDNPSGRIDNNARYRANSDFDNFSPILSTKVNKLLEELRHEKNVGNVVHNDYGFTIQLHGGERKSMVISKNDDNTGGYIVTHYVNGEEVKSQEIESDDELVDHITDTVKSQDKDGTYRRRRNRSNRKKKRGKSMMSQTIQKWLRRLRILPPIKV